MNDIEKEFIHELEVFRTETQSGTQYFYAYLTIESVIRENQDALKEVNETPLFWNTNISALQIAAFITLGRIFDKSSPHNIANLLGLAKNHKEIFSKQALAERKRQNSSNADEWLPEYLKKVHEPTKKDFKRLEKHIEKYRGIYDQNYRNIRNKIYAHKELTQKHQVEKLFERTKIRELEILFVFLNKLCVALWELLYNGKKPILLPIPYSLRNIKQKKIHKWQRKAVHQMIVSETQEFFSYMIKKAQHSTADCMECDR